MNNPLIIFLLLLLLPITLHAQCESESELNNKSEALKYKLIAIASILVASTIGILLPIVGKFVQAFRPENNLFFLIKAFAAGVILATGFIHVLPDAFESLTSACLGESPWGDFPFAGFVAMVAAIVTMMVDTFAMSYYHRLNFSNNTRQFVNVDEEKNDGQGHGHGHVHLHTHASHGSEASDASPKLLRQRIVSQVLELGIVVHSVIIGISLGASMSPKTIKPLVAALTFHQLFEGMGLGGCISQAKFKARAIIIMAIFFSLTTPIGIVIGFGISNVYNENSKNALIVEGVFNSASAGILVYMALVDLIAADFMNPKMLSNLRLLLGANFSLLIGCGCMSLLAKWA
ncbi:hypothetical protein LguiA_024811 [Lonicera macranthoides]